MINIKFFNKLIFFLLFFSILNPLSVVADNYSVSSETTITISATVGDIVIPPSVGGGGGGGGSGGATTTLPTVVNFSGMAYPSSKVTILQDGQVASVVYADKQARFSSSISGLNNEVYNFSVFGETTDGMKSLSFSFPVYVTVGSTVNIGGIFLSPTINIDKSEVKKGDNLVVFGQTVPNTNVNILFHSDKEIIKNTKTDATGLYSYNMNTEPLEYGDHNVKSKTLSGEIVSAVPVELPFKVGLVSKLKDTKNKCDSLRGDLNCEGKVNLVDFSIMAYWYKRQNPPSNIDLNGDGKINLVDFSIMAYNWTG